MIILKKRLKRNRKKKIEIKKKNKNIANFNIHSTFNNTIINLSNCEGDTISWSTSTSVGFKGCKKSMHYASQVAAESLSRKFLDLGYKYANIYIKGCGVGRDFAVKGIYNSGIHILTVHDLTPVPHNGCRRKKISRK